MRTTLSIDDDVLEAVRERARRDGRSIGDVLSDLARRALNGSAGDGAGEEFHGFRPLPPRGRPVTNALIDRLSEDDGE